VANFFCSLDGHVHIIKGIQILESENEGVFFWRGGRGMELGKELH